MATAEREKTRRPRTLRVAAKDLQPGDQIYDDGEISRVIRFAERGYDQVQAEIEGPGPKGIVFPEPDEEVAVLQKDRGKITPLPGYSLGVVLANAPAGAVEAWTPEQLELVRDTIHFIRRADALLVEFEPGERGEAMTMLETRFGVLESWILPVQDWEPNADDVIPPHMLAVPGSAEDAATALGSDDEAPEHEGVVEEVTRKLGDVVEHIVTEALDQPDTGEAPKHGKDPVDEGHGRLALDTGDTPTITNEVIGPRPSKAALVFTGKPKPIPVNRNYQPGENCIVLLWCGVGRATVGGEVREHEFAPLETLLWEDAHLEPGKALDELRTLDTRADLTKRIIDYAIHLAEKLRDTNAYESDVDFLTDLRDKLYDRYHLTPPAAPAPITADVDGVVNVPFDGRDPQGDDDFYDSANDPATAAAVHAGALSPDALEAASEQLTAGMRAAGHDDATVTVTTVPAAADGRPDEVDQRTANELGVAIETSSFLDDGPSRRVEQQQDAESLTLRWERLQEQIDRADPGSEALLAYSEESEHVRQQIIAAGGVDPESAEAYELREAKRQGPESEAPAGDADEVVDAVVVDDEVDSW